MRWSLSKKSSTRQKMALYNMSRPWFAWDMLLGSSGWTGLRRYSRFRRDDVEADEWRSEEGLAGAHSCRVTGACSYHRAATGKVGTRSTEFGRYKCTAGDACLKVLFVLLLVCISPETAYSHCLSFTYFNIWDINILVSRKQVEISSGFTQNINSSILKSVISLFNYQTIVIITLGYIKVWEL